MPLGSYADEVVGQIKGIIVEAATSEELDETVFDPYYVVARADAPNDVRIGDGITPGGLRVCPQGVLTNIPASFPHPIAMNGNSVALNGAYTIGAEGSHCYIRSNGSNVLSILAQPAGIGQTLSTEYAGNATLRVMLAVEDASADPLVEYATNSISPSWTNCSYTVTRSTTNTMQVDIAIPTADRAGYYRITALTGFRVRFGIPLEAPVATLGNGVVVGTSGREITRTLNTDALALSGGDHWDTGAFMELGGDSSSGDVSGGSAQLILRNTSSRFRIRERQSWIDSLEVYGDGRVVMSGATFMRSGTNMLLIIGGVTNRIHLVPQ